jgi:hypothetical protein
VCPGKPACWIEMRSIQRLSRLLECYPHDSFATFRRVVGSIRKQPEGIDYVDEIDCDCTGGIGGRVCVRAALGRWHRGSGASVCSAAKVQLRAATAGLLRPRAGASRRLPGVWLLLATVPRLRLSPSLRPPLLSARSSLALTRTVGCQDRAVAAATFTAGGPETLSVSRGAGAQ